MSVETTRRRRGRTTRRSRELATAPADRRRRTRTAGGRSGHPPRTHRGGDHRHRSWFALVAVVVMLSAAAVKLVMIQTVDAPAYAAKAAQQLDRTITLPAARGTIYDRNGTPLAFTVQGRAIAAWPALFTSDEDRWAVATILEDHLAPDISADDVFRALTDGSSSYVYLARGLLPAQADAIIDEILDTLQPTGRSPVTTERQDLRQYPEGAVLQSIVGATGWDGHGMSGIEIKYDDLLSGVDGERTVDIDAHGNPMPGTVRNETAPVDGGDITLTIDANMQFGVQELLQSAVEETGSAGGMVQVRAARTGDVYALATYYQGKTPAEVGNPAVTSPFEPGSVVKVVTMGAALDAGLITPETHFAVEDSIVMGGHVIHDAWPHSRVGMTATGILAKSSNVGTLMIAEELGQDSFAERLTDYGIGVKSGIQLPAASAGVVPPQSQWSATSFSNLPLGQGLSMTLVQISDLFQGIANDGVRIPSSIVSTTTVDGETVAVDAGPAVRQMSRDSANTLLDMLRGTVQEGNMLFDGTAPGAAVPGYQVAGKTGTAQQVDQDCGCYSKTKVTAAFSGIVPADDPALVITVMLDAPRGGAEAGGIAGPLFKEVAAYALRSLQIPPSPEPAPMYQLYTNWGE